MNVAQPLRSLLSRRLATAVKPTTVAAAATTGATTTTTTSTKRPQPQCRHRQPQQQTCASFHSSARLEARRKPRFKSIRAEEMGLVTPDDVDKYAKKTFPGYTEEEMEVLRSKYTPEQLAALEAGEAAIDPQDLTIQGRLRRDPYRLPYLDDFSRVLPIVDKRPRPHSPPNTKARFLTEEENFADMIKWMRELVPPEMQHLLESTPEIQITPEDEERLASMTPQEAQRERDALQRQLAEAEHERMKPLYAHLERVMPLESTKLFAERSSMTDSGESNSSLVPELGQKLRGVEGRYKPPIDPADNGLDDTGIYQNLKRRMGVSVEDILGVQAKVLVERFVSNQTRLGKIQSVWVLAIAGNGNGRLGVGEAKSVEPALATLKARLLAIQNMRPIRRYEDRTIFGKVRAKVGATVVEIASRPPGFGLRASHRFFEIFRAVGIQDIAAKMPRARNPMNSVKACVEALTSQKDPEELAIGRGKKFVDVRKVYYGGNVF